MFCRLLGLVVVLNLSAHLYASGDGDFTDLSLEELMNIPVTSVSRREQLLWDAPAAVSVLTAKDLTGLGVTTIPDALRFLPGVHVAQIQAHIWAVSVRGFVDQFATKLLVLIDGRSVYNPLFSGVYWDRQDVLIEDIERIELVRGPGATVWGANAVNGVINIITRPAGAKGTETVAGFGSEQERYLSLRHNIQNEAGSTRLYGRWQELPETRTSLNSDLDNQWFSRKLGFRSDLNFSNNSLTLQGEYYDIDYREVLAFQQPVAFKVENNTQLEGGFFMVNWGHKTSELAQWSVQLYYSEYQQDLKPSYQDESRTVDLELQSEVQLEQHKLVWGVNYRRVWNEFVAGPAIAFVPPNRGNDLASAFVQDEIAFLDKQLFLTVGTKVEYQEIDKTHWQPNVRLLWKPKDGHQLWASVARAVRTPARVDKDLQVTVQLPFPPFAAQVLGSKTASAEILTAYELGYRLQTENGAAWDLAMFYNDYDELRTFKAVGFNQLADDAGRAIAVGAELSLDWPLTSSWRFRANVSYLDIDGKVDNNRPESDLFDSTDNAQWLANIWNSVQITPQWHWDFYAHWVDDASNSIGKTDDYISVNSQLRYQFQESLSLSLLAKNLNDDSRIEAFSRDAPGENAAHLRERSWYLKLQWGF